MHAAIAVAEGDFRFDPTDVTQVAARQWPDSRFVELHGVSGRVSYGQVQVPSVVTPQEPFVLASVHRSGLVISIDGSDPTMISRFASAITTLPGFPAGDVWLMEFAPEPIILQPGVTAEALLALRGDPS